MASPIFPPSRSIALSRLAQFAPKAGHLYASSRNIDTGPDQLGAVSKLSPYVRRRLITESEIVAAVLACHGLGAAEKFVQEVLWRTYWKGWLEMRPAIWARFLAERDLQRDAFSDRHALSDAENGLTGIEGFDDWARELTETGYLHNHARMWFASIWIFTLRLPWTLGADFFLRHLIDADAASNTLSWRWVAGLQTTGKTYLATTENIARYTNGRFAPVGLAREAIAVEEPPPDPPRALPEAALPCAHHPALLLITEEDMHPESVFPGRSACKAARIVVDPDLLWGEKARHFADAAAADTASRVASHFECPVDVKDRLDTDTLMAAIEAAGVRHIVSPYTPVGPVADMLARVERELAGKGVTLTQVRRDWDERFWPHATKGFFAFKDRIPSVLHELGLVF
jgi:deoxyribodipyrimidine photo-lyase